MFFRTVAAATALLVALGGSAAAQSCGLTKVASYEMQPNNSGLVVIKMKIGGEEKRLAIDTGAWFSFLSFRTVTEMKLPHRSMSDQFVSYGASGRSTSDVTTAPSLSIGPLDVPNVDFIVAPAADGFGDFDGLLGANVLKHFDLDFDFANRTVNFFDPDHCPGQVVYWTSGGSAEVPFKFNGSAITVPVKLDGQDLYAVLDSGAFASLISRPVSNKMFNIDVGDAGVVAKDYPRKDGSTVTDYTHTFGTLTFGGVTVANPLLHLEDDKLGKAAAADNARQDYTNMPPPKMPEILLGVEELKHLHLYISYKEKTLYVTAADAH